MSPKKSKSASRIRGTPKWILAELRSLRAGASLSTEQLAKRIAKARGKKYHRNSIYNALRLLVRRGEAEVVKTGRQKFYRVLGAARGAEAKVVRTVRRGRPPKAASVAPAMAPMSAPMPHKLASGEILVLSAGDRHIVSATNKRGKLVLKKHPLP